MRPKPFHFGGALVFTLLTAILPISASPAPTPETCAGTLDPGFANAGYIRPTVIVADGDKVIVAHQQGLIRFFANGAVDPSFAPDPRGDQNGYAGVYAIHRDAAGRWLIGGVFTRVGG